MYFSLTMLSSVGYGDYYPINPLEQIFAVLIMLQGVAVFSWVRNRIMSFATNSELEMLEFQFKLWLIGLQRFPGLVR